MEMFIGGAYQGQKEYAEEKYPHISWVEGNTCSKEDLFLAEGVLDFHNFIKKAIEKGEVLEGLAEEMIEKNPHIILVLDEVGYGVVPMDAIEREYRESVGRICIKLAEFAEHVHRVVCGIGMVIK